MSDTDNEGTEFTVGQLTAIVAKLKKKLARFEYRLETTIIHQKLAGKKASLAMLKAQEAIAMEKEQKEARLNMSGTTIPIGLAKKIASYTVEQLQDFDSHIIGGIEYGVNVRGDVVDIDGKFVGHYNYETKKLTKGTVRPSDWNSVIAMD